VALLDGLFGRDVAFAWVGKRLTLLRVTYLSIVLVSAGAFFTIPAGLQHWNLSVFYPDIVKVLHAEGDVEALAWSPDENRLAALIALADTDTRSSLNLWDTASWNRLGPSKDGPVQPAAYKRGIIDIYRPTISFTPNGNEVLVSRATGAQGIAAFEQNASLLVYSASLLKPVASLALFRRDGRPAHAADSYSIAKDQSHIVVASTLTCALASPWPLAPGLKLQDNETNCFKSDQRDGFSSLVGPFHQSKVFWTGMSLVGDPNSNDSYMEYFIARSILKNGTDQETVFTSKQPVKSIVGGPLGTLIYLDNLFGAPDRLVFINQNSKPIFIDFDSEYGRPSSEIDMSDDGAVIAVAAGDGSDDQQTLIFRTSAILAEQFKPEKVIGRSRGHGIRPYLSPSGRYIAFTTNNTIEIFKGLIYMLDPIGRP
jgi:hypothetical protein